ncbi:hypothetical protein [Neobacillus muris]|uniref:hypothetical protein n=1 Tax=Neobacillus muris TaxID=2941334 RepID=UPI0020418A0D|nr:hypothetical protein [Neobacillus muris]
MIKPQNNKEKLLAKLTEIYDQLEELEVVLNASFSNRRCELDQEEQGKLAESSRKLSVLEDHYRHSVIMAQSHTANMPQSLKLELGF